MKKRRLLAILLAACMIVESTSTVSATTGYEEGGVSVSSENTEGIGDETPAEGTENPEGLTSGDENPDETPSEEKKTEETIPEVPEQKPDANVPETPDGGDSPETLPENPQEETGEAEGEEPLDEETGEETDEVLISAYEGEPMAVAGEEYKISDPEIYAHTYGMIRLQWNLEEYPAGMESTELSGLKFNIYRSKDGGQNFDKIAQPQCEYNEWIGWIYEDTDIDKKEGNTAENKEYYYYVTVADSDGSNASEPSATVSNKGLYYYSDEVHNSSYYEDYKGLCIIDEKGKKYDDQNILTLTEGETVKLRVARILRDGKDTIEPVLIENVYFDLGLRWYICNNYVPTGEMIDEINENQGLISADQIEAFPYPYSTGSDWWDSLRLSTCNVAVTAFANMARDEVYYLTIKNFDYTWQIPFKVVASKDGNVKMESNYKIVNPNKEEIMQTIRDLLVARADQTVLFVEADKSGFNAFEDDHIDQLDIVDFSDEREGMKPWEGDYLNYGLGDPYESIYFWKWLSSPKFITFNGEYYHIFIVSPQYLTTREQEDMVDAKIDEIINQPGGALYNYRNASDYSKIKAAYDYAYTKVKHKTSYNAKYHTCYAALFEDFATCEGTALLLYRLLREMGIPNRLVVGDDPGAHGYNIVKLGNLWYYVDATKKDSCLIGENDIKRSEFQDIFTNKETGGFLYEGHPTYVISDTSYGNGNDVESKLSGVESLKGEDIEKLDTQLLESATSRMSATYKINGGIINATGTVKYLEGCKEYLGYESGKPTSGYFLAMKIKADASKFKENGYITISYYPYSVEDGNPIKRDYAKTAFENGYLDVILNITENNPNITITVDYDTSGEGSVYEATIYTLDLSGLKKEDKSTSLGSLKEINEYGVGLSSPAITMNNDGTKINVSYDEAVAYSFNVTLPKQAGENNTGSDAGDNTEKKGLSDNYIALRLKMPDAVKDTILKNITSGNITLTDNKNNTTEQNNFVFGQSVGGYYIDLIEDKEDKYIDFVMPVTEGFNKTFKISWGDDASYAFVQELTIKVDDNCVLETPDENALLPSSIAFNGLVGTMYVGQTQDVSVSFKKKYEQDTTQVYFTTSDNSVILVNRVTGQIKALKTGTANITVSAVNSGGETISKSAKITVKALSAPASVKVSDVKDTSVSVSWKANTTGQYTEVYAIPYYNNGEFLGGTKAANWKGTIEKALADVGMDENPLASLKESTGEVTGETTKEQMMEALSEKLRSGACVAKFAPAKDNSVTIDGLEKNTPYVFYVRNVSKTAVSTMACTGVTYSKTVSTTKTIFDHITLTVKDKDGKLITAETNEGDIPVYEIREDEPLKISYALKDKDEENITAGKDVLKSAKFNSTNTKIVSKFTTVDKTDDGEIVSVTLNYGAQVGDAVIYVTGKDASNAARDSRNQGIPKALGDSDSEDLQTSGSIIIRRIQEPTQLKNKTTTLTIGQSITIKELVGTNLTGSLDGMNLDNVNFKDALAEIKEKYSDNFVITEPDEGEASGSEDNANSKAANTKITAAALIGKKSGKTITNIPFHFIDSSNVKDSDKQGYATIKINDMAAPSISKVTVKDTSAEIQFKPSATVNQIIKNSNNPYYQYYYTLNLTDTVTKSTVIDVPKYAADENSTEENTVQNDATQENDTSDGTKKDPYTCEFTNTEGTVWTCVISGLSSSKTYEVELVAHCILGSDEDTQQHHKSSKKKFTTTKPLLNAGGSIDVKYIDLDVMRTTDPNAEKEEVKYAYFKGDEAGKNAITSIEVVNNKTYVLMAQVTNLARALDTDKLKWTISSGDKKAGSIKASSSSYEARLTTTKVGTFTVTATSTVTKAPLATFEVHVIPYQSKTSGTRDAGNSGENGISMVAYLPENDIESLFKLKQEDAA